MRIVKEKYENTKIILTEEEKEVISKANRIWREISEIVRDNEGLEIRSYSKEDDDYAFLEIGVIEDFTDDAKGFVKNDSPIEVLEYHCYF